ncbi:MAG: phosphatase PAP2 family protein [Succinivibrio sp.]|nr:phosphatase PAP2 family protein [Succinivibrio sp.]
MNRMLLWGVTLLVCAFGTAARCADDKQDLSTHYLTLQGSPAVAWLLPAPPSLGSPDAAYDEFMFFEGQKMQGTKRWDLAREQATETPQEVHQLFSKVLGITISKQNTPDIYKLLMASCNDAIKYGTSITKRRYYKRRPFAYFDKHTCRPEEEASRRNGGSYPSGHTAVGTTVGLLLSEIAPEKRNELMSLAYEFGQSRVICGYHWQSDVDNARLMAIYFYSVLHGNKDFISDLAKAKKEYNSKKTTP